MKNKIKGMLYADCSSLSPIKPSIELRRSFTEFPKRSYKITILNLFIPAIKGEVFNCVNEYLETSQPNVWALVDADGKFMYKHVANYEAEIVYYNAVEGKKLK